MIGWGGTSRTRTSSGFIGFEAEQWNAGFAFFAHDAKGAIANFHSHLKVKTGDLCYEIQSRAAQHASASTKQLRISNEIATVAVWQTQSECGSDYWRRLV
jgi:hypothetical protein